MDPSSEIVTASASAPGKSPKAGKPRRAMPPQTKSSLERVTETLKSLFDRSDSTTRAQHDLVRNVAMFAAVVYAFHNYGHKLAV